MKTKPLAVAVGVAAALAVAPTALADDYCVQSPSCPVGATSGSVPEASPPANAVSDASAPSAEAGLDRVAPAISNLKISPRRFAVGRIGLSVQRGGRLTFALSESAQVRVTVRKRSAAGKLRAIGSLQRALSAGQESLRIGRRVGNRTLSAGSYLAQIVATDASGNSSLTSSVRFAVVGS